MGWLLSCFVTAFFYAFFLLYGYWAKILAKLLYCFLLKSLLHWFCLFFCLSGSQSYGCKTPWDVIKGELIDLLRLGGLCGLWMVAEPKEGNNTSSQQILILQKHIELLS